MSESESVIYHLTEEEEKKRSKELADFLRSEEEKINAKYDTDLDRRRKNVIKHAVETGLLQQKKASKQEAGKLSRNAVLLDIQKNLRKRENSQLIQKKKK